MSRKPLLLLLALLAFAAFSAMPAFAAGSVVQEKNCGCSGLAFTSNVTSGHLLVAVASDTGAAGFDLTISDSLGDNWNIAAKGNYCVHFSNKCNVAIYFTTAISTGPDTVTQASAGPGAVADLDIYEVSGTAQAVAASATGSTFCNGGVFGNTCAFTTSSSNSFSTYGFLIGASMGGCSANSAGESGYAIGLSGGDILTTEYSVSGVSSPTSYTIDSTCGAGTTAGGPILGAMFALSSSAPSQSTTTQTVTSTSTTTSTVSTSCTSTVTTTVTATTTVTTTVTTYQGGKLAYTVTTNPPGLASSIEVDGVIYTSPQTFYWTVGSNHTIAAVSPCNLGHSPYTSFTFLSWSDGGLIAHVVTAPTSSTTYTANFKTTATSVSCGSPNPLQQLERACVVPALLSAWSAGIGLQPWLGFVLLGTNVAIYNKTQSVMMAIIILFATGATFFAFLPAYVGLIAQVMIYIAVAGTVVRGILFVR